jgi:hypothetical protein
MHHCYLGIVQGQPDILYPTKTKNDYDSMTSIGPSCYTLHEVEI